MPPLSSSDAPLRGPFYTRRQAAQRAGLAQPALASHPGALRIEGPFGRHEAYPAFQFAVPGGFIPHLPEVVAALATHYSGGDIAAWLLLPNQHLGGLSIVAWLEEGRDPEPVMRLVVAAGGVAGTAAA